MKNADAVSALAALAQENRLDVFRLLVQAGPEGMPAGSVADDLKIAPNTLPSISTGFGTPDLSPCAGKDAR